MSDKSLRGWKALLDGKPGQLMVIGGSAMSAPEKELDPLEPHPVELSHGSVGAVDGLVGFADVGMRLAYTEKPSKPADQLRWLVLSQPYIGASDGPATQPVGQAN